jgi:DNA-binding SARP family transcriptional activator
MSRFSLTLCGRLTLAVDGVVPAAPPIGAKTLALLAYLVLEPGPHRRDALTALLWGDFPEPQAKASLRQALTRLHQVLGDGLDVSRTSVALVAPVECDVAPFLRTPAGRRTPGGAADQEALRADVPHFLEDLRIRQCSAFEEWAAETRRALLRRYVAALDGLARDALVRLDWRAAAAAAARWRLAEPLSDAAAQAAIAAQVTASDHQGALAIFAEHEARLRTDGRSPSRALRELAEQVQRQSASAASRGPTAAVAEPVLRAQLRGRDREWTGLQHAWHAATTGTPRVVLIEGESGAGKTRLAGDLGAWVTAQGAPVLIGRATEAGAAVPFGLISGVLRSGLDVPGVAATDGQWLAEVARLVPDLRARLPGVPAAPMPAPGEAWRLFEAVAQMMSAIAAEQPVLVLLDDIHWSDADSAAMVQFLVGRPDQMSILWCATVTPGMDDRASPTGRLARALRDAPYAEVFRPARLDAAEVASILEDLARRPASAGLHRLARHVHEQSAGTAGYVIEMIRALGVHGTPAFDESPAEPLPVAADLAAIRAPLLQRIERLPDDARAVLVTIAIADGARCDPDILSQAHGVSRLRAAALGEVLLERGLVVEGDDTYRCAHPVIAAVVRDGVSASWRRAVQRALADLPSGLMPGDDAHHQHADPPRPAGATPPPA